MERRETVKVKSGKEYDHLFPGAALITNLKKESASVDDTLKFIPQVVKETLHHTKAIALLLKADNVYQTCKNIWQFIYDHIAYRKDEDGKEQIRSPARTWHDRLKGVDCDLINQILIKIPTLSLFSLSGLLIKAVQNKQLIQVEVRTLTTIDVGFKQVPYTKSELLTLPQAK